MAAAACKWERAVRRARDRLACASRSRSITQRVVPHTSALAFNARHILMIARHPQTHTHRLAFGHRSRTSLLLATPSKSTAMQTLLQGHWGRARQATSTTTTYASRAARPSGVACWRRSRKVASIRAFIATPAGQQTGVCVAYMVAEHMHDVVDIEAGIGGSLIEGDEDVCCSGERAHAPRATDDAARR